MTVRDYFSPQAGLLVQVDKTDEEWADIDLRQQELNETISPELAGGSFAHVPPKFIDAFNNTDTLIVVDDTPAVVPEVKVFSFQGGRDSDILGLGGILR